MEINCLSSSTTCSIDRRVSSFSVSFWDVNSILIRFPEFLFFNLTLNDFNFRLHSTDISRNRLAKISEQAFVNLANLTYLDVAYNKLSALEIDYMCHLPRLQTLNISGNVQMNLLDIREVFENLTELRSLSIADITNMPSTIFEPLSNLHTLNISGTHLGNETNQILGSFKSLKVSLA